MKPQTDKNILDIISLASKYPSIKRVGIFGSYARGEQQANSDLDLLYDYDDANEHSTDDILSYIEEINDSLIKITNATKIDYVWYKGVLESLNEKFKTNLLHDVTWVYS
ncbi:MAG: nucleotidyltransferase domain-containing protein [Candidatus Cloacimonetes bacterium]|nr:nucleotidyltransferase domain-containing protein [Candidatus Cloacimonadota bacterium]